MKHFLKSAFLIALLTLPFSCALFENDVADFMEKYTETAAVEQHSFSYSPYTDESNYLCIPSDQEVEINFYLRNPKKYSLIPSASFNNLDSQISRSGIRIEQTDFANLQLSLTQDFLISADEGKDITPLIKLYEPMSGRNFDSYSVRLYCNSKPPLILNPTILNNNNQNFVLAFDMPNEEDVAIRHKDLVFVEIDGVSYPVEVTTSLPDNPDPETPDVRIAHYNFPDTHFKRSYDSNYTAIGGKSFVHNSNNSVYFESDDAFFAGDKEYKIVLKDKAGLSSEVKASTSISKLEKPLILDQNNYPIADYDVSTRGFAGIPYNEETEKGLIKIIPPNKDHLGNPVNGATVYYKIYETTGNGHIYTSGSTSTEKVIELPQNTYRAEAYAVLTNYETSATKTVRFRFINNQLYVRANVSNGDGSEAAPYATIAEALADINDKENRPQKASVFTIYVEGDFTTQTSDKNGIPGNYGRIEFENEYNANEIVIAKNPNPKESNVAKLEYINLFTLDEDFKVTLGNITISNTSGDGVTMGASNTLVIDGTEIQDCSDEGIESSDGTIIIKSTKITRCNNGISASNCELTIEGGEITGNTVYALQFDSNADCLISGGTVSDIYVDNGCALKLKENPVGKIKLASNGIITVADKLLSGCHIEIDTPGTILNLGDNPVSIVNNYIYNTEEPSTFFTSTQDYSIIKFGNTVAIMKPGTNGEMYNALDYDVIMTASSVKAILNRERRVVVSISGVRKESGGTLTNIYYNNADKKFYTDSTFTSKAAGDNTVSWNAALYNDGIKACDCTLLYGSEYSGLSSGTILVAVPAISFEDSYTLKITSTFLGVKKEANIEFKVTKGYTVSEVISVIQNLTEDAEIVIAETPTSNQIKDISTVIKDSSHMVKLDVSNTDMTTIPDNTFKDNNKLSAIVLPDSLTSIGDWAFMNCFNLTSIIIPSGVSSFSGHTFQKCTSLTSIVIPEGITTLGREPFLGCTSLTSVILPDTFEILEARFVKNCTSLTYIRIPASVTTIEYEAFQGTSITSISLPDGLTLIDSETFSNCTQLTSITIPASVTEIKYNAFLNCNNLTTINYKGSEEEKNNIIINASGNSILSSITWNYNYTEN